MIKKVRMHPTLAFLFVLSDGDLKVLLWRQVMSLFPHKLMGTWSIGMQHQGGAFIKRKLKMEMTTNFTLLTTTQMAVFWHAQVKTDMLDSTTSRPKRLPSRWRITLISVVTPTEYSVLNSTKQTLIVWHLEDGTTQSKSMISEQTVSLEASTGLMFVEMLLILEVMVTRCFVVATDKTTHLNYTIWEMGKSSEILTGMVQVQHKDRMYITLKRHQIEQTPVLILDLQLPNQVNLLVALKLDRGPTIHSFTLPNSAESKMLWWLEVQEQTKWDALISTLVPFCVSSVIYLELY